MGKVSPKLQKIFQALKDGYDYTLDWDKNTGVFYFLVDNPDYKNPWDDHYLPCVELVEKNE